MQTLPGSSGEQPDQRLAPGQQFGDYRIVRELGRGGMGVVYEAESVSAGRRVALKLLTLALDDPEARQRFLREGRMAAAIMHPNSVYVYGTAEIDGTPVIAMELVSGGTLDELVKRDGPLPVSDVIQYALQLIDGLEAAASAGILHRDVKPSNCFLGETGLVKIGDFGLSKPTHGSADHEITQRGHTLATPAFASPEQLFGESLDVRADIYSLGATLYFLLSGRTPFTGANSAQLLAAVLEGTPRSLRESRTSIPAALETVVVRCLARHPEHRYSSYAELRDAIANAETYGGKPAPVARRFSAALIDLSSVLAIAVVLSFVFFPPGGSGTAFESRSQFAFGLVALAIVKALPEHFWGWSLGKRIEGLRVVGANGNPPSLLSSAARALCWTMLFTWRMMDTKALRLDAVPWWCAVLAPLLMMLTMRRRNGYASALDLLLRTRVIQKRTQAERRRFARAEEALAAPATETDSVRGYRLGPTVLLLADGSRVRVAQDSALGRAVWVHQLSTDAPDRSAERRGMTRAARLRWIDGERGPDGAWDAYGAPDGARLLDLPEPASWPTCVGWLEDIVQEVREAARAGDAFVPRVGDVWIASGQQVLLLDFRVVQRHGANAVVEGRLGTSLRDIARRALMGPRWTSATRGPVLAMSINRFLAALPSMEDPDVILEQLRELRGAPLTVARARYVRGMLVLAVPVLLCVALFSIPFLQSTPDSRLLGPFIEYLVSTTPADTTARVARDDSLAGKGDASAVFAQRGADSAVVAHQRSIVVTWLRSTHGAVLTDSVRRQRLFPDDTGGRGSWSAVGLQLASSRETISSADSTEAARVVEQEWKRRPPATTPWEIWPWESLSFANFVIDFVLFLFLLLTFATIALTRRGLALRTAVLDIADLHGSPAPRRKLILRSMVHWAPLMFALPATASVMIAFFFGMRLPALGTVQLGSVTSLFFLASSAMALAGGVVMLLVLARNPARGPGDLVAGTVLVPE